MDVIINSRNSILQAFQLEITFDDTLWKIMKEDDCVKGSDWPDPKTFACAVNLPGKTNKAVLNAQDVDTTSSMLMTSRVHVGTLLFTVVRAGE